MKRLVFLFLLLSCASAHAQSSTRVQAQAIASCGGQSLTAGVYYPVTQDLTGTLCTGSGGGTITANVTIVGPIGQKAMAASVPVAIASDQSSFPVAATLNAETTKVIGTVNQGTSPWVVSGTVTANQGTSPWVVSGPAPSSSSTIGITPVVSASAEATHVLKASAGNAYSVYAVNYTATAGFLVLLNSTTAPADGAITPLACSVLTPNGNASINYAPGPPGVFSTGITAVITSAATCATKTTGVITGFISGSVQ